MIYLIQANDKELPVTEVGYQVIEACDYYNWYNNCDEAVAELYTPDKRGKHIHGKVYAELYKDIVIPVGTIEWVEKFLKKAIRPINIPKELNKESFLQRKVGIGCISDIIRFMGTNDRVFVKSNTRCKSMIAQVLSNKELDTLDDSTEYFFSEDISDIIDSEWRVFVQRGNILDCRMYLGDWYSDKPDKNIIENMVKSYKNCPPAYTLDVANIKTEKGIQTVLIEVHNFISCGLYGFNNKTRLLSMLSSSYKWEASLK